MCMNSLSNNKTPDKGVKSASRSLHVKVTDAPILILLSGYITRYKHSVKSHRNLNKQLNKTSLRCLSLIESAMTTDVSTVSERGH